MKSDGSGQSSILIIITVFTCLLVLLLIILASWYYCFKRRYPRNKDLPSVFHDKTDGSIVVDSSSLPPHSATAFGSLQRQKSLNRKFSTRSHYPSSSTTEQYFTADIIYDPEWEVRFDSLRFTSLLGEGAFGRVMKGISDGLPGNRNATIVAVKMLKGKRLFDLNS